MPAGGPGTPGRSKPKRRANPYGPKPEKPRDSQQKRPAAPISDVGTEPRRKKAAETERRNVQALALIRAYEKSPRLPSAPGRFEQSVSPGDIAHGLRVGLQAATGADVRRLRHPVRAYERNVREGEERGRRFEASGRTDASLVNRSIVPWVGPLRAKPVAKAVEDLAAKIGPKAPKGGPAPAREHVPLEQARERLLGSMPQATRLRRQQEVLRSEEKGRRVTAAAQKMAQQPGRTGYAAAREELRGKYPTVTWGRHTNFDQATVDDMIEHIKAHPDLQGPMKRFTQMDTIGALLSVLDGNLPRKFEQRLLRDAFGDQVTDEIIASVGHWQKAKALGMNLIGVPRTLMASFDLSAPLRQGLLFGVSHPVLWGKSFPRMIKAAGSERVYNATMQGIAAHPNFDLMTKAGVPFTDLGSGITHREEAFMSSLAERIPGIGHVVRASNRGYTAFLNKARADYFNWMVEQTHKMLPDLDLEAPEAVEILKTYARVIGNATGRGTVRNDTLNKALPALNQVLFAPRLLKSRLDVIANPRYYAHVWGNPVARKEAFKQLGGLVGLVGGVVTLASLAGAKVVRDPRNADFAKVRIGNTRFDIAGGFQQPVRLIAQLKSGKTISSTTGEELNLTAGGFGNPTRFDVALRFLRSKTSPPASFIWDWSAGTDFAGQPFEVKKAMFNRLQPLLFQDAKDLYDEGDSDAAAVAAALAVYGVGMWGIGAQTYGPRKKEPPGRRSPSSPYGPSSGGRSNPYGP